MQPETTPMCHRAAWRLTCLALALIAGGSLAPRNTSAAPLDLAAEVGNRFESNASNSDRPGDQLADGFLTLDLDLGTKGVWGRDWRWRAGLSGQGEMAYRFFGLGQIDGGIRLGIERKFGLGWSAPRFQFDLFPFFRGSGQSGGSGFGLVPSISFVWQMLERGGLAIRYVPSWFFAQGALFNSAAQEAGISGWFDLFPSTRLFVNYAFRYGDVVSYATPPRPDLAEIAIVKEPTDVFGAERMAYRFDATTRSVQAGVDQTLTAHLKLRAMYRFEITQRGTVEYANHIAELGLRVKF
jgi:hypothetical protein